MQKVLNLMIRRGPERVLRECRPVLSIEMHSTELTDFCTKLLRRSGYEIEVAVPAEHIGHGEVVQVIARPV